ncbi:MAG TPA: biopolymer transporter ExbD [Gammaproteobacteria bacterium]|jgi:biopolymer transport protein ExbD|nr:biopolymer transporter ExbD [Gammaproteobacteria bacterium]HIM70238.1 biopolymer transporter ExbD [Gammaproteobacteria bacterium]HIN58525.1 biopolymer transporter ExbD [Gammaproteobacteria bacterium]|tara:strand:+ start:211 stop:654 length:444 start_codon:yes stop_codon:yes gene_type:complete
MKFSRSSQEEVTINLTPLIDIVFLLLIFFMVSTTFSKESQLRIRLPDASPDSEVEQRPSRLVVAITKSGDYSIRGPNESTGHHLLSRERSVLAQAMAKGAQGTDELVVVIRADRNTPHEAVVRVMDVARKLGLVRITFATQKPRNAD